MSKTLPMEQNTTMPITSDSLNGQNSLNELHTLDRTSSTEENHDIMSEFMTAEDFSQAVEYHVRQYGGTYVDAIMEVAIRVGLDVQYDSEYIKELIDRQLKENLHNECVNARTIRGETFTAIDV